MNEVAVLKAAGWWANLLWEERSNSAKTISPDCPEPTQQQAYRFGEALCRQIRLHKPRALRVDYEPDFMLSDALEKAGLNHYMRLPPKTTMIISDDQIEVSKGYGKPFVVIWSKEDE